MWILAEAILLNNIKNMCLVQNNRNYFLIFSIWSCDMHVNSICSNMTAQIDSQIWICAGLINQRFDLNLEGLVLYLKFCIW